MRFFNTGSVPQLSMQAQAARSVGSLYLRMGYWSWLQRGGEKLDWGFVKSVDATPMFSQERRC